MRFVFEHNEIFFRFAVDFRVDANGTSVDFVGNIEIVKLPVLFQLLRRDRSEIHKARIFFRTLAVEFLIQFFV